MKTVNKKLVTIIIPTFNNPKFLNPMVNSLLHNTSCLALCKIIIVNNGHNDSISIESSNEDNLRIINMNENVGWEGALKKGMEFVDTEFVFFMNDDIHFFSQSYNWLTKVLDVFKDEKVAAIGPSSNVVMGAQNIFMNFEASRLVVPFLIGFCMFVRTKYLKEVGGIITDLPGGDDIDLSIRFKTAGYKLVAMRDIFVYHHGFKTGERLKGGADAPEGWNSVKMQEKTNTYLQKKHGVLKWWEAMSWRKFVKVYSVSPWPSDYKGNPEKDIICNAAKGHKILDLGCGAEKCDDDYIGVDILSKGTPLPLYHGIPGTSVADITGDIENRLPVECDGADTIIAKHVLEHCIDPIQTIKNWKESLKEGGRIIISVPDENVRPGIPMNPEHLHAFTPQSLFSIMETVGFSSTEVHTDYNGISFTGVFDLILVKKENDEKAKNLQSIS